MIYQLLNFHLTGVFFKWNMPIKRLKLAGKTFNFQNKKKSISDHEHESGLELQWALFAKTE